MNFEFERFIYKLVEKGVIPGASLLIGKKGEIIFKRQYGFKSIFPRREILKENTTTLYDLASLTKPLVTALLTVYLAEKEKVSLETGVKKMFPHLPFDMDLRQLLTHTSGLPARYPFYLFGEDYLTRFSAVQLDSRPGKRVNYSCVGYILLYYVIEKLAGTSFQAAARQIVFNPIGLKNTFLSVPEPLKNSAAPTEKGDETEKKNAEIWIRKCRDKEKRSRYEERLRHFKWRDAVIQGEAHDVNSHYLGGTAGNAGLFSTAEDVFKLCLEFFPSTASLLSGESLPLFWKNFTPFKKSHRTLGFKLNSSFITSGGRGISGKAIGHSGVTGTSIWLDPRGETVFILLSNQIHSGVRNFNFNRARRKLHRLICQEKGKLTRHLSF